MTKRAKRLAHNALARRTESHSASLCSPTRSVAEMEEDPYSAQR